MRIAVAATPEDFTVVRTLFQEYATSLGIDLCFQGFAAELATLPGQYAPPRGCLLIATKTREPAGCVALRPLTDAVCEMKRLYVRPAFRGQGLGKRLARAIVAQAGKIGYSSMRLDTLPSLETATRLYESLGFVRCDSYYDTPLAATIFMELRLASASFAE
jgi:ribosomal protein S18 acetylase RimI-like enzyme